MKCLYPIQIFKDDGYLNRDGLPYVQVPCGHCGMCRKERSKAWALRLMMESMYYRDSIFLTLTYDDLHIPLSMYKGNVVGTLDKEHLQRFWKRLRRDLDYDGRKIKYYAVGEYGDTTFRPHYHAIVFGLSKYDEELIKDNWSYGIVDVGNVEMASCNYVAGYIQKKLYGKPAIEVYGDRVPPYSAMSKGIGKRYVEDNFKELIQDCHVSFRGVTYPVPRYFWEMMIKENLVSKSELAVVKSKIVDMAIEREEREMNKLGIERNSWSEYFYNDSLLHSRENALKKLEEIKRRKL